MGNSFCAFGERSESPNRTSTMLKRPELEEALSDYMNNTLKLEGNKTSETTKSKFKKEDFEVLRSIGRGACGKISLVKKIDTGERFAMKTIKKSTVAKKNLMEYTLNEKDILKNNSNPYIVDLYYAFQDEENIYMVLEFVQGGDLYTHLNNDNNLPESRVRLYAAELLDALVYLHSKGIIYRDLKPENILLGLDGHLKLVDFGFAKILQKNEKCDTLCGTPQYVAPEILLRNTYDESVDWWNLGCVIHEMLVGVNPFYDKSVEIILKNIVEKRLELPANLTKNAKNLLEGLLHKNPEKRLNAKKIKEHPFFKGIDWKKISNKQMEIDFIPVVDGKEDFKYFDNGNLDDTVRNEQSMVAHENYADFSYAKH